MGQQIIRAHELCFALAGEADNDVRRDGAMGQSAANSLDQRTVVVYAIAAPHFAQNVVVACLHRHLNVRHHLGQSAHGVEQFRGHVIRVRGQEADALQAVDIVEHAQQVGQAWALAHVVAIAIHYLSEQGHFLDALRHQGAHLAADLAN